MNLTTANWTRAQGYYQRITRHYGAGPYYLATPELVIFHDPADGFGYWEPDLVWLNFAACESWHDVVSTLIHEFWHHHQGPERTDTEAYESEANAVAARDVGLFLEAK